MGHLWSQGVPNKTKCQTLALILFSSLPNIDPRDLWPWGRQLPLTKAVLREDAIMSHQWPTLKAAEGMHTWVQKGGISVAYQDIHYSHRSGSGSAYARDLSFRPREEGQRSYSGAQSVCSRPGKQDKITKHIRSSLWGLGPRVISHKVLLHLLLSAVPILPLGNSHGVAAVLSATGEDLGIWGPEFWLSFSISFHIGAWLTSISCQLIITNDMILFCLPHPDSPPCLPALEVSRSEDARDPAGLSPEPTLTSEEAQRWDGSEPWSGSHFKPIYLKLYLFQISPLNSINLLRNLKYKKLQVQLV